MRHRPNREESFRRLFHEYYADVLAYALRRTSQAADAQDVVAETFTVAWRRLDAIPADNELPWLYAVAARTLKNQQRSHRRLSSLRTKLAGAAGAKPESDPFGRDSRWSAVVTALAELTADEQEILRLAAWEGLSHREIGVILRCSENAASLRLHRARKSLAAALEKETPLAGHERGARN